MGRELDSVKNARNVMTMNDEIVIGLFAERILDTEVVCTLLHFVRVARQIEYLKLWQ
jgi:hypothetical protein